MMRYWKEMENVFGVLAYVVKSADPDGLDLRFSTSLEVYNSKKSFGPFSTSSSTKLLDIVHERRRKIQGTSNIDYVLDLILSSYINNKLAPAHTMQRGSSIRPLNIYILSDGMWEDGCDPSSTIKKTIDKLTEFGYHKDSKQIGIQFILFGDEPSAQKKIQDLDDNLGMSM